MFVSGYIRETTEYTTLLLQREVQSEDVYLGLNHDMQMVFGGM